MARLTKPVRKELREILAQVEEAQLMLQTAVPESLQHMAGRANEVLESAAHKLSLYIVCN